MSKPLFEYFKECFTLNYANFNGRARRREYWGFLLFNFIISAGIGFVLAAFANLLDTPAIANLGYIYSVAAFLPALSVGVRRLHDIGKSGWYMLVAAIPFFGLILLIYWFCQEGQAFENEYGPNPKEIGY